ncbi:hypothetical protein LTR37_002688 [Vermiconidia calcicola]|uniref:Uncharacterized protein n=1 Tax=Vermiconidia calcicola TaxID=1690605 RepID=A0ACC3NTS4_9PEZI|nr:hypothetical protein LTR37_002688 [Vermiconidia calcicola]
MASSTKYKTPQRNFTRHIEVSSDASPDSRETKPSSDPAEKTLDSSRVQEVDASYLLVSEADTSLSPTHSNPGLQDDTAFTDRAETVVAETRLGKQSSAPAADGEAERCASYEDDIPGDDAAEPPRKKLKLQGKEALEDSKPEKDSATYGDSIFGYCAKTAVQPTDREHNLQHRSVTEVSYTNSVNNLSAEEEAELHPEVEGALCVVEMAHPIRGVGKVAHIFDFSSQILKKRSELFAEDGMCITPGYIKSLYALYNNPSAPVIFYQEHARAFEILQLLPKVRAAITSNDYTALINKFEVKVSTRAGWHWYNDEDF